MKNLGICLGLAVAGVSLVFGCDDLPGERIVLPAGGGAGNLPNLPTGLGVGEDCSEEDCRPGLACEDDVCVPAGTRGLGDTCLIGPECAEDLQCIFAVCVTEGDGEVGDPCEMDSECMSGLKCSLNGFSAECAPAGEGDLGAACLVQTDCYQGLYCVFEDGAATGECSPPVPPLGVPLWEGVSCPEREESDIEALFYVPGAEDTPNVATFFDLPYPNDIRLGSNGRPDLDGFPTPGPGLIGVDIVAKYVEAVESNTNGWSTNPSVIFRFSGGIDYDSVSQPDGGERRIQIIDTDGGPSGDALSYQWSAGSGSNYVCDDWLAVRAPRDVLLPGHTYIVYLTEDIKDRNGGDVARSEQFQALMAPTAPSDPALADAYDIYAPVRALPEADSIINAAVFTTDEVLDPMRDLAAAVEDADMPTVSDWVKCGEGAVSPCAQADEEEDRACGDGASDYDEYQALLEIPIFQEGTAPYLTEGGAIQGSVVRTEQVCMSMSVPTSAAPGSGWPLVIYGHGTGGSYRGAIRDSVAGALAQTTPAFATLGFDEVQHGPRRGEGEDAENDPDNLFFNFLNPDAARGNPLQGAADVLSVIRWASQGSLATAGETGDAALDVDPTKIYYFGHSQGSTHGSIAVPFSDLDGAVFSGNGGGLVEALLNKTNPVNIAGAIPLVVQDADSEGNLRMGDKHPVLGLLQHYIDAADPLNFAALSTTRPEPGQGPRHIFQTFGLDDTYSPPTTLARFIYAAGLTLAPAPSGVNPQGDNELSIAEAGMAVTGNLTVDTTTVTAVCRQYEPANGSDGHFVVHDVETANEDAIGFLEALGNGVSPTIPAP